VPVWTLTLLLGLTPSAELAAAASSSTRPAACRAHAGQSDLTLWTRTRPPELVLSCRLLARGLARLPTEPAQALALAAEVGRVADNERAAKLLAGRAYYRLGRVAEAWAALAPFADQKALPLDDAASLVDLARTALAAGDAGAALRSYRLLVPRAALLGSRQLERTVLIEAASLALAGGPGGLDEALGYLDAARAIPLAGDRDIVLGFTALALDRAGQGAQARAAAREADGPWDLEAELSPAERSRVAEMALAPSGELTPPPAVLTPSRIMLVDGELHAAIALLALGRDEELRRVHLRAFLASGAGHGPWAEYGKRALAKSIAGGR
jgi:hypothetical protein